MNKKTNTIEKGRIKDVRALAKILNESQLSAVEICEGDYKIRLEKTVPAQFAQPFPASIPHSPAPMPVPINADVGQKPAQNQKSDDGAVDFNNLTEVKSPMIGVFYAAPSPDSPPYVKIGQKVSKGDVLCIVEAMKMLNEITAETSGEIVDICASNGQLVEFSQVLFKIF